MTVTYTWDDAVHAHRAENQHCSAEWRRVELHYLHNLDELLRGESLPAITRARVEAVRTALIGRGYKPMTINHHMKALRAVLNGAVERDWLAAAPRVRSLKVPPRVRWLSVSEVDALLRALPAHLRDMVAFALETGLRKANVAGLRWGWVDLGRGIVSLPAEIMKARRPYCAPLSPLAISILRRWEGVHPEVVFTWRGQPVGNPAGLAWRKAVQAAGLVDFHWHDLRHTWASWLAQDGAPHSVLKALGGWSCDSTLARYTHLTVEHLRPWTRRQPARAKLLLGLLATRVPAPHASC